MDSTAAPFQQRAPGLPAPAGGRRALRAARIIHPFPTLLNVAATAGLAFVAARGAPDGSVLWRMLLVMLFAQSAIGVTNDYFDRDLDAATKPWKPIVAGLMRPAPAAALAAALIVAALLLAATLAPPALALVLVGLGCGLAYDVRLKRTAWSAVPYMIAIPTLPLWVWVTLGRWQDVLWWLVPLGALIGVALHLQNTLPDIDADASRGVAGMAHRLGAARSMFFAWASFGTALLMTAALVPFVDYDMRAYAPSLAIGGVCFSANIGVYALRRDGAALQFGFGLLAIGSAVIAAGWLAAVS